MIRMFFSSKEFDVVWERMGLTDEDRRKLENSIAANPKIGNVIRGTGGLRKMRFAPEGQGKSGGARVLYVDFVILDSVYLVTAFPKSQKEDLTQEERSRFKNYLDNVRKELNL